MNEYLVFGLNYLQQVLPISDLSVKFDFSKNFALLRRLKIIFKASSGKRGKTFAVSRMLFSIQTFLKALPRKREKQIKVLRDSTGKLNSQCLRGEKSVGEGGARNRTRSPYLRRPARGRAWCCCCAALSRTSESSGTWWCSSRRSGLEAEARSVSKTCKRKQSEIFIGKKASQFTKSTERKKIEFM